MYAYGNGSPMRACHRRAQVCARVSLGAHVSAQKRVLFVGVECVEFGLQAFFKANAFNANIGAWNTASVIRLDLVCAAFGRRCTMRQTR